MFIYPVSEKGNSDKVGGCATFVFVNSLSLVSDIIINIISSGGFKSDAVAAGKTRNSN